MTRTLSRAARSALVAVGALCSVLVAVPMGSGQRHSDFVHQRHFRVDAPWGSVNVLATWLRREDGHEFDPNERVPILVALHGRGEAVRGPERGYLGWSVDYDLPAAMGALARGRLTAADYQTLVRADHLRAVNASLRQQPFRGLLVITPYTPDLMDESPGSARIVEFADWLAGPLLSDVRERFPLAGRTRASAGVDGVSLGGMLSLETGLRHPEAFGCVGALQPAIRGREEAMIALARAASPRPTLQLVSSDGDPFLGPTRALSTALRELHYDHSLVVMPGPHDYPFNRGPGAIEMLLFHDCTLAREAP